jgi:hypothetical protein
MLLHEASSGTAHCTVASCCKQPWLHLLLLKMMWCDSRLDHTALTSPWPTQLRLLTHAWGAGTPQAHTRQWQQHTFATAVAAVANKPAPDTASAAAAATLQRLHLLALLLLLPVPSLTYA